MEQNVTVSSAPSNVTPTGEVLLGSEQFKPENAFELERRSFEIQVRAIDEEQRTIEFIASNETPDRAGDIIRVNGWDTKSYMKNPVFLWSHRSGEPPIGKTIRLRKETNPPALVQKVQFADAQTYPFADTIFRLYKGGFLRAVSVGFLPKKKQPIQDDEGNFKGWDFLKQELLELSGASVPMNPEALARAVQKGVIDESERGDFVSKCGDRNPSWANLVPGVTCQDQHDDDEDEKEAAAPAQKPMKPSEQLEHFCEEGRELARRVEGKLDSIHSGVYRILDTGTTNGTAPPVQSADETEAPAENVGEQEKDAGETVGLAKEEAKDGQRPVSSEASAEIEANGNALLESKIPNPLLARLKRKPNTILRKLAGGAPAEKAPPAKAEPATSKTAALLRQLAQKKTTKS